MSKFAPILFLFVCSFISLHSQNQDVSFRDPEGYRWFSISANAPSYGVGSLFEIHRGKMKSPILKNYLFKTESCREVTGIKTVPINGEIRYFDRKLSSKNGIFSLFQSDLSASAEATINNRHTASLNIESGFQESYRRGYVAFFSALRSLPCEELEDVKLAVREASNRLYIMTDAVSFSKGKVTMEFKDTLSPAFKLEIKNVLRVGAENQIFTNNRLEVPFMHSQVVKFKDRRVRKRTILEEIDKVIQTKRELNSCKCGDIPTPYEDAIVYLDFDGVVRNKSNSSILMNPEDRLYDFDSDRFGRPNKAIRFRNAKGSGVRINEKFNRVLRNVILNSNTSHTFSFWLKDESIAGQYGTIFTFGLPNHTNDNRTEFTFRKNGSSEPKDGAFTFFIFSDNKNGRAYRHRYSKRFNQTRGSLGQGDRSWHHYALVFRNSSKRVELWEDGKLVSEYEGDKAFDISDHSSKNFELAEFVIGANSSQKTYWVGLMDEFLWVNKALSKTEIEFLANDK